MTIADIAHIMETWAPPWTAWERDNVGLQVGDRSQKVKRIGIALDITESVVEEAVRRKTDLLVSHHPMFFHPPRTITTDDRTGRMALRLIEHGIAVFSSHTNLDSANGGVNSTLAKALGLKGIRFLAPLEGALVKLAVFVPVGHTDDARSALAASGAGVIGNYTSCTFNTPGVGTFRAEKPANPYIGTTGTLESAEEVRIEAVVPRSLLRRTIDALRAVHPYDEMAYDVYSVENPDPTYGIGAVGSLARPMILDAFLRKVKRATHARHLRYSGLAKHVQTVAVCGGSGGEYVAQAKAAGADVYVTSDIKYHAHQESTDRFVIVDAGHYETEHLVLPAIATRLRAAMPKGRTRTEIYITRTLTNPVHTS